jgi:flagellar basal body P-ring protein FlgI
MTPPAEKFARPAAPNVPSDKGEHAAAAEHECTGSAEAAKGESIERQAEECISDLKSELSIATRSGNWEKAAQIMQFLSSSPVKRTAKDVAKANGTQLQRLNLREQRLVAMIEEVSSGPLAHYSSYLHVNFCEGAGRKAGAARATGARWGR